MVTEQVEKNISTKSPINRESKSHDRTFELKALSEGKQVDIIDVQVKEQYSPMHYDLEWSTPDNKDVPFVGTAVPTKSEIGTKNRIVPPAPKPSHSIVVVFKDSTDTFYMRWNIERLRSKNRDFLKEVVSESKSISPENPIKAIYEPNSKTGGTLKLHDTTTERRVYKAS